MKYLLFFLLPLSSFCQTIPSADDFFSIKPQWSYISYDSNFVPLDPNFMYETPYSGRFTHNVIVDNDHIYLLEAQFGSALLPIEGYLIHDVDLNTGNVNWITHNNYYSGNIFKETPFGGNMLINQAGNLEINGFMGWDTLDPFISEPQFARSMKHIIDYQSGEIVGKHNDTDTSKNIYTNHNRLLIKPTNNGKQYKIKMTSVIEEDGYLKNYANLFLVDEFAVSSKEPVYVYEHNTHIHNGVLSFTYGNTYQQINANRGAALFGTVDPLEVHQPTEIKLLFFDTKDPNDIKVIKNVDLLPLRAQGQTKLENFMELKVLDNNVIVGQKVLKDNDDKDKYIWMSWYDAEGNELNTIDRLQYNGKDITKLISHIVKNKILYVLAFKRQSAVDNRDLYVFYKIEKHQEPEVLTTFTGPNPSTNWNVGMKIHEILDNNDIIVTHKISFPYIGTIPSSANFLCRYSAEDFGMITATVNVASDAEYTIYPNPVADRLYIQGELKDIDQVEIIDLLGRSYSTANSSIKNGIDVSRFSAGVYILQLKKRTQYKSEQIVNIKFIKK
ncbi:MAG: T9SS type A sorting domain-containing protein [Saprospiraceae bacterium]